MSVYDTLIAKLQNFIKKYYQNQLIRGVIYSASLLLSFFLLISIFEYLGEFNTAIRTGIFYGYILVTLYVLLKFIITPISKILNFGKRLSNEQAAEIVGNHFAGVRDKLLNIIQLQDQSRESQSALLLASIDQKSLELNPVPFHTAIDFKENKKHLKLLIPIILFLLGVGVFYPKLLTQGTSRIIHHSQEFIKPAPFAFNILNKSFEVVQTEDFNLLVETDGEIKPSNIFIEIEGNKFRLKKAVNEFSYLFKNAQKNVKFKLYADEIYSQEFELKVLSKPVLLSFKTELKYPAYTGINNETKNNLGDLLIPEGTEINWDFEAKNTDVLSISLMDSVYRVGKDFQGRYTLRSTAYKSQPYVITTANSQVKASDSIYYSINVIPDQFPSIEVVEQIDSTFSKLRYFKGMVKDDYGLRKLTFNYRNKSNNDSVNNDELISEEIKLTAKIQDQFFYAWDLTETVFIPGQEIEYFFEVWDNDGIHGSKSSKSELKIFKAPTKAEIAQQTDDNNKKLKDNIEENILEAKMLQKELKEVSRKLFDKKELTWEDKNKIEQLLEKQKELEKNIDALKNENQENVKKQNEFQKVDEKLMEKQKRLEELFEDIMTEEMKELFREMEKLMEEQMDKKELQEMLENMELSNKDMEKELDRTLELFKQLEFEQKLEETIEKLDELTKKQEELQKKTEEKNETFEELKKEQDEIKKEFDELKKDLKNLKEKNEDLENKQDMPDTKDSEQKIEEEMQQSSDNLSENKSKKSGQNQQNASDELKEMQQKMQEMQEQMQEQANEEDLDAMRQLLENLIQLSFDQEQLMADLKHMQFNDPRGAHKQDPRYFEIGKQQKKLKDDAKMVEDSLFALSKRVPEISSVVNREISAINQNLEKVLQYIEERKSPDATTKQQFVMTSINNLALLIDEAVQQMQQQMAQQKFGDASCSKPGKNSKPKPGSMKKLQEQLNKQMQQMKDQMGKEGEQSMPGSGQGQKMSEQLAKMAAQQEAIRNQMKQLSDDMDGENGAQGKENLNKLQELMEQTETDLVNKQITQQTLRRQQDIMTRLLEHDKAEREREKDDKRESKEALGYRSDSPAQFLEYNKLKEQEMELLKTVPPKMKPFYKNKVNMYFNNL